MPLSSRLVSCVFLSVSLLAADLGAAPVDPKGAQSELDAIR